MQAFLSTVFDPADMALIDDALIAWRKDHDIVKGSTEDEIAAAIVINLFREGNNSAVSLEVAMARHRALRELAGAGVAPVVRLVDPI